MISCDSDAWAGDPAGGRELGHLVGDPEIPQPSEPRIDTGGSLHHFLLPHPYLHSRWEVWEGVADDSFLRYLIWYEWPLSLIYGPDFPRVWKNCRKMAMGILEICPSESAPVPLLPLERFPSLLSAPNPSAGTFPDAPPPHLTSFCTTGPSFPVGSLPWPFQLHLLISEVSVVLQL